MRRVQLYSPHPENEAEGVHLSTNEMAHFHFQNILTGPLCTEIIKDDEKIEWWYRNLEAQQLAISLRKGHHCNFTGNGVFLFPLITLFFSLFYIFSEFKPLFPPCDQCVALDESDKAEIQPEMGDKALDWKSTSEVLGGGGGKVGGEGGEEVANEGKGAEEEKEGNSEVEDKKDEEENN